MRPVLLDALRRCITRETSNAARAPQTVNDAETFTTWTDKFYNHHADYCINALRPVCEAALLQATGSTPEALEPMLETFATLMIENTRPAIATAWADSKLEHFEIDALLDPAAASLYHRITDLILTAEQ